MNPPKKLNLIIVDPELDSRMRLKTAAFSTGLFENMLLASSYHEAIHSLGSTRAIELVFVTYASQKEDLAGFLKDAKNTKYGQDACFVVVLKADMQQAHTVVSQMVGGIDGFLFEPYSVQALLEISELAREVYAERSNTRKKAAARLLFERAGQEISRIASNARRGKADHKARKDLLGMTTLIKELELTTPEVEHALLLAFENKTTPSKQGRYQGASERVSKRSGALVNQALAELRGEKVPQPEESTPATEAPKTQGRQIVIRKG